MACFTGPRPRTFLIPGHQTACSEVLRVQGSPQSLGLSTSYLIKQKQKQPPNVYYATGSGQQPPLSSELISIIASIWKRKLRLREGKKSMQDHPEVGMTGWKSKDLSSEPKLLLSRMSKSMESVSPGELLWPSGAGHRD